jgi:hypothetical protein
VSVAGVSPLLGAGLRSVVAARLLCLWSRARGERLLRRDGTAVYDLLIGLMFAGFWTPLFGVLAGRLLLGKPLSANLGAAAALVALGIYLVASHLAPVTRRRSCGRSASGRARPRCAR